MTETPQSNFTSDPADDAPGENGAARRWTEVRQAFEELLELDEKERSAKLRELRSKNPSLAEELSKLCEGDRKARLAEHELVPVIVPGLAEALAPVRERIEDIVPGTRLGPWRIERRLDSGGMGAVYLAQRADAQFEKTAAIKIVKRGMDSEQIVSRFALERSVLAKLEHPGIARLLDAGIVPGDGRPYLVMEYVDGEAIDDDCNDRSLGVGDRAELMQRVCDIVHVAHTKLVVHRDLKPSNVFVTRDGSVKLLDFGISKLLDPETGEGTTLTDSRIGTPLTPDYASPEQVRGEAISTATDVYSLGVLLCELLSGSRPLRFENSTRAELEQLISESEPNKPSSLVRALAERDPPAAETVAARRGTQPRMLAASLEGDLDNIVLKALAKEPHRRYASAQEFGQDLQRYREGLPVIARPDTGFYRASKFVRRNRAAVAATVVVALALVTGLVLSLLSVARTRAANRAIAQKNTELEHRQREILGLSDRTRITELTEEAAGLWPAWPENQARMESWLQRAEALGERLDVHRQTIERIRSEKRAEQGGPSSGNPDAWTFVEAEDQWQHDTFMALLEELEEFATADTGAVSSMRARIEQAELLGERMAGTDWREAIERIADPFEFPQYEGLEFEMETGLAPLGPDPDSGLYEFCDLQTGEIPERDADDQLIIGADSGIIFVLIPGGDYWLGAQRDDPTAPHYDVATHDEETPVQGCRLDPFLISKYEMTCAQWLRVMEVNPSKYVTAKAFQPIVDPGAYPVDNLSWLQATEAMRRMGGVLPTEAQWEAAARAGTDTPWFFGGEAEGAARTSNVSDQSFLPFAPPGWDSGEWDDGFGLPAPVGEFDANPFGLHDVHGNVWEWARDPYFKFSESAPRDGDGLRTSSVGAVRVTLRSGAWNSTIYDSRSAYRLSSSPDGYFYGTGLRPARTLSAFVRSSER